MASKEMSDSDKKAGLMSRRRSVTVQFRPTNPKLKFVSREEFIRIRKKENEANQAANEARNKVLSQNSSAEERVFESSEAQESVESIREQLRQTKKDLEKDPKSVKLKKRLARLEEELNQAEDEAEEKN